MALPIIISALVSGLTAWIFTGSLILGLVMAGLTLLVGLMYPRPKFDPKPASLSDFSITQSNEAQPIPIVYGTVTLPGNIIFYGNLVTEEIKEHAGKGGGGGDVTVGYKYYLDIWQAICHGKVELVDMYLDNDTNKHPEASYTKFNDGTQDIYPTVADAPQLEFASKLPSVAHIFFKKFLVGENRTFVPTVYFRVKRVLSTGLPYENMSSGSNPAAAVYELLTEYGGINSADIDVQSFRVASEWFNSKNYGINYIISSTVEVREACKKMLSFVDAYLDYTEDGKICIKILKPEDQPIGTIEDDFIAFSFSKPSWNVVPNTFVGNYVETDASVRTLIIENVAAQQYSLMRIRSDIDLTVFTDRIIALDRLSTIMKRDSYPRIALSLKLPLKYAIYRIGDVITVKNSELGMSANFRVVSVSEPKLDSAEIDMTLLQHTDLIFDDKYSKSGGTAWVPPSFELKPFTKMKIIELKYNPNNLTSSTLLILVSRETGFETGFQVWISTDGVDYKYFDTLTTFSTAYSLVSNYPVTYDIDDDIGLILRPYKEYEGKYSSVSRAGLFSEPRVLVVDNEIMKFQNYIPYESQDYKITGIIRNVLWSGAISHSAGAQAFITYLRNNSITLSTSYPNTVYFKLIPVFAGSAGSLESATPIRVELQRSVSKPELIQRLQAIRTGTTVKLNIFGITKEGMIGAGKQNADTYTDIYPFEIEGSFEVTIGTTKTLYNSANIEISQSGAFTVSVRHFRNGFYSEAKTLTVGAIDGEYVS